MIEPNNIYLGDAYKLIKEIPDKSIDCIYTDIPYEIDLGGCSNTEIALRIRKNYNQYKEFSHSIDFSILDEFVRVMKNLNIYIWCSKLQIPKIMNYFLGLNADICFEILTWCKTNPAPNCNGNWLSDIEYCLYFKEKNKFKYNDGIEFKHKYYISQTNKKDKDLYGHPTIKPLEFVEANIQHTTQPGDIILDPFCGSGTTCVACKETGRKYIGFELNEEFYNIAINRIKGITKKERDGGYEQLHLDLGEEQ